MRQIFLDTETTGLSPESGDRIVEIGCVEMVSRRLTGNHKHFYLNPERRGHEDAIHIMRGSRGVTSRDIRKVVHFPESQKPVPIVPKRLIEGVSERVDCFGEVVVALNEAEVKSAMSRLVEQDVEAIVVCFLWSFKEPRHELRVKAMIRELAPHVFVSCSVDIAPKWGEYERITATVLNAYIGPVMAKYLGNLDRRLSGTSAADTAPVELNGMALVFSLLRAQVARWVGRFSSKDDGAA